MINKETIDKIFEAARIDEVIGDFVNLKKRGANYVALSPFVNEKTPSFYVSPAKNIFKDFSSGKGGNAVTFVMEHEKMSYPEALRYLAKKYNIEIEEDNREVPEEFKDNKEKETLFAINAFAQTYFTENLLNTDEGRSVGLSYFKERGLSNETIAKFQLGYGSSHRTAFIDHAVAQGYEADNLVKAGLVKKSEHADNYFDFFAGRVMYPIHNITGRVVGFGGRTLSSDKKIAKYFNSPESEIYHKSKILYGLHLAKKSIISEDNCYLVEGYMDVISMVQAGVENVVASSGTSLTEDQVRIIKRYTNNITILYDGDSAGIKAALRGLEMILSEGMNVKILLFTDGDDPDSFARKVSKEEFKAFVKNNARDFISFKTGLLMEEANNDPIKKAELIKDIVHTISLIPDGISRSVYIKECSKLMEVGEQVLISELNALLRKKLSKKPGERNANDNYPPPGNEPPPFEPYDYRELEQLLPEEVSNPFEYQEKDIARLLIKYGERLIDFDGKDENGNHEPLKVSVAEWIQQELSNDNIELVNPIYQKIVTEVKTQLEQGIVPPENFFIQHSDPEINKLAVDFIANTYDLSRNWEEKHGIFVTTEDRVMKAAVRGSLFSLKLKKIEVLMTDNQHKLKATQSNDEMLELLQYQQMLINAKKYFSDELGRVVLK